jgi:hypothetical protein
MALTYSKVTRVGTKFPIGTLFSQVVMYQILISFSEIRFYMDYVNAKFLVLYCQHLQNRSYIIKYVKIVGNSVVLIVTNYISTVVEWLALLFHIWGIGDLDLILGLETCYPDRFSMVFVSPSRKMLG